MTSRLRTPVDRTAPPVFARPTVKRCLRAGLALLLSGWLLPAPADALQVLGLQAPESFVVDPAGDGYFISSANGDPDVKDNNGFITKLDKEGAVIKLQFIRGGEGDVTLHAPKGMAIVGSILYVADLDVLRAFDKATGKPIRTVAFPPASPATTTPKSLADVVHDGAALLYVSDTESQTVYRVDLGQDHRVSVLVRDPTLAGPRGLAVHPKTGHLIVTSWDKGKILDVSPAGAVTELVSNGFFSARFHNLDGVDFDLWGNMYVADFSAGKIWRMRADKHFDVIAEYLPSPAGISIDRANHLILVPYHYGNAAEINGLERPVKRGESQKRTLADYGFAMPGKDMPGEKEKLEGAKKK